MTHLVKRNKSCCDLIEEKADLSLASRDEVRHDGQCFRAIDSAKRFKFSIGANWYRRIMISWNAQQQLEQIGRNERQIATNQHHPGCERVGECRADRLKRADASVGVGEDRKAQSLVLEAVGNDRDFGGDGHERRDHVLDHRSSAEFEPGFILPHARAPSASGNESSRLSHLGSSITRKPFGFASRKLTDYVSPKDVCANYFV